MVGHFPKLQALISVQHGTTTGTAVLLRQTVSGTGHHLALHEERQLHHVPEIIVSIDTGIPEETLESAFDPFDDHVRVDRQDRDERRFFVVKQQVHGVENL